MEGRGWRGGQVAKCGIYLYVLHAVNDRKGHCMICMM